MSNSLLLHGLQHARLPCSSPSRGVCSKSCPLSQWCHPTISSSVAPFSSCSQSFPASGSFPMSQLLALGAQSKICELSQIQISIWRTFKTGSPWRGRWKIIKWVLRDDRLGIQGLIPSSLCHLKFFYLLIFDYAGSSLLHVSYSRVAVRGLFCVLASLRVEECGLQGSGLSGLEACRIFPDQGPNPCPLCGQVDS